MLVIFSLALRLLVEDVLRLSLWYALGLVWSHICNAVLLLRLLLVNVMYSLLLLLQIITSLLLHWHGYIGLH